MTNSNPFKAAPLYEQLAAEVIYQVNSGIFQSGDRLPSVRQISKQKGVSVTTVLQAYQLLEGQGVIEARPQSGYYVRTQNLPDLSTPEPETSMPSPVPNQVRIDDLVRKMMEDMTHPDMVQFGAAFPAPDLLPTGRVNRTLARMARLDDPRYATSGSAEGCLELRTQVARRAFLSNCSLSPDDILITCGCMEAIHLALLAVCNVGDLVAIESPTYFGILQSLEALGLRALEIPTHHRDGISLDALSFALEHHPIHAVLVVSNFNNPLGSCMPEENKRRLVELIESYNIPLIEDDIYGELSFNDQRPGVCKAFDRKGLVLLCSSFSKDISPSFRVGWITPGRYRSKLESLKFATNLATPILPQLAIAEYLDSGGYEHHLRKIRRAYAQKVSYMAHSILRYFPENTRVTSPNGGFVLWVQLPGEVDSLALYRQAFLSGISLAPGYIFSATNKYRNFIRLNAAYMSFQAEHAIEKLGEIIVRLIEEKPSQ
jgi:DNA-binding transcriptional MocR family regulator